MQYHNTTKLTASIHWVNKVKYEVDSCFECENKLMKADKLCRIAEYTRK